MKKLPVSVLIDTYNHERFIEQAIVSVLEQDFPREDAEILVVDDGSTDRTPEILRRFEPQIRILRKKNGGQASAFNAGIPEARGEIVAFLDGDDWWAPRKLSRVAGAMAADPSLGIVGNGIVVVGQDGARRSEILREGFRFSAGTLEGARLFQMRRSFLGTSRMTIRATLLRAIGPVPESIAIEADEYLFTLAATLALAQILPEPLTYYRLHDSNGFQVRRLDPVRHRNIQRSLAALAAGLTLELEKHNVEQPARRLISDLVHAEADRARLTLDGGWPWETVRTEWLLFRTAHPDATMPQRLFKSLRLLPAFVVPPRSFYQLRSGIAGSHAYRFVRSRWLPAPRITHIATALKPRQ